MNLPLHQRGAALIVGLLLLVVITILAVSGMNTAFTELAMARNDKTSENVFQSAEKGLEVALAHDQYTTGAPTTLYPATGGNESVTATVEFEAMTIVPDRAFSLGAGSGIAAYHFLATSEAEFNADETGTTDRDASATHSQAFYVVGPEASGL